MDVDLKTFLHFCFSYLNQLIISLAGGDINGIADIVVPSSACVSFLDHLTGDGSVLGSDVIGYGSGHPTL